MLTVGLVFVVSKEATPVSAAKTCFEAENDFYDALDVYDVAFYSYYHGIPTSSASECTGSANPIECEETCMITRHTALGNSFIDILEASAEINGCTNPPPDRCANAQAVADACLGRYDYTQYSDAEQRLEIYNVYSECRTASGIDTCE